MPWKQIAVLYSISSAVTTVLSAEEEHSGCLNMLIKDEGERCQCLIAPWVWLHPCLAPGPPPVMTFQFSLLEDMGDDFSVVRTETQSQVSAPYQHTSAFLWQLLSVNSRLMILFAYGFDRES